ncbi:MAG: head GIN domain-containing protein [Cyclobacteriaceae bacterium]
MQFTRIASMMIGVLIFSQSYAQVVKKTFDLPEFKGVYANAKYEVYIKQSNKQEVRAEALKDILDITKITVEDGILMINIERKNDPASKSIWSKIDDIKVNPTLKIYVSMKEVNVLQVNGGGKIISENSIASDDLDLRVTGSGGMDIDIKGKRVNAELSGSGNMLLKGYATTARASLSGSGSLNAFNFELESCEVVVSGNGNAELNVREDLNSKIMGSGWVKHKGNTKKLTSKVYGSGDIERAY